MKTSANFITAWMLLVTVGTALATVRYVDLNSPNPAPPYTNWASAARVIQVAVDAAVAGDEIVVTNGIYATGGREVSGTMTNRVAVNKPLTLRSANGPKFTIIQGHQVPGATNGDGAIRCVYLTNGASLSGFTLTDGSTLDFEGGGGVWCESSDVAISDCVLSGNSAAYGGGTVGGTLNNCTLSGNYSATYGGGAAGGILNNCTLTGNSAFAGGGASAAPAFDSGICVDAAEVGGWAYGDPTFDPGVDVGAPTTGGGADADPPYGFYPCILNNCTLSGNSALLSSGGAYYCTLNNCIVYFNMAANGPNYDSYSTLSYCCTTPLPPGGIGNISADPQLTSVSHLSASSPCRGAGSAAYASGLDIDGEAWANPPSMGCDEVQPGAVTGPLGPSIQASYTNATPGFVVNFSAVIGGRVSASRWDFGGTIVSNRPYASHSWAAVGDYPVVLWAYNETYPNGVSATVKIQVVDTVYYVAATSSNPVPPYISWATAARNIQDAVDAATVPGALVLVAKGIYSTGGRAVYGAMTNRVAVDKPLTLRSVNGPEFTTIQGYQVPGATNGNGAIRCVYLTKDASLSGFTLTRGATRYGGGSRDQSGGGVWCEVPDVLVSNCVVAGNSATSDGGGAVGGTLNNCILRCNSAIVSGGGAAGGTLNHCTLSSNSAYSGGGAYNCTLSNCALSGNSAGEGGGAHGGTLNNCTLTGNSAAEGGGAWGTALSNSTLSGNSAGYGGGAAWGTTLNNCTLSGNSAGYAGGAAACALDNCILYYNAAAQSGANYDESSVMNYCCTTPPPTTGVGNISAEPQLASASHLSAGSPCRGAGSAAYTSGVDIEGEPWGNSPSIGCDEFYPGTATGPLTVAVQASFTSVATDFDVNFNAQIIGHASDNRWEFGDDTVLSNRLAAARAWSTPGDYAVSVRAYNQSYPGGISATVTVHVVSQLVHYVAAGSSAPATPYSSWATAASSIQDAVEAAFAGGTILVSNGVYASGGRAVYGTMTNRVAVTKPLTLRSVNGPEVTVIRGYQVSGTINGDGAVRCVYLTNGAALVGFTLTYGATRLSGDYILEQSGGGVWCEWASATVSNCLLRGNSAYSGGGGAYGGTLNNCTLTGNAATAGGGACGSTLNNCTLTANLAYNGGGGALYGTLNNCTLSGNSGTYYGGGANGGTLNNCTLTGNSASAGFGGGAYGGTLNNCMLTGNSASARWGGGGACCGTLNNCTLTGNTAGSGGGADDCTLNNCIVYFNTAPNGANYYQDQDYRGILNYCCTTPFPTNGLGNFTNAPLFVYRIGGNLRLQSNSPCINAGFNGYAPAGPDLDGHPRILGGIVDIGAFEFLIPGSLPPVVLAQPADLRLNVGDLAVFSVVAEGPLAMDYQWFFNGSPAPGKTNATLVIPDVQIASAGAYAVVVSNVLGSVTSSNALLQVNRPPVADASATPTRVISPNGTTANIVLDGSRSSDPDGDPLTYLWLSTLNPQLSTTLATGMVAVVVLPVGTHAVELVVNDGLAQRTNTVTVTVLTSSEAVQQHIALVNRSSLEHPRPLVATLEAAVASIARGDLVAAANQLHAFQNQVRAQVAPVDPALADSLLAAAEEVVDALGGAPGKTGGRIHSVKTQPGGKVQLKFTGTAGGIHVVQASTNLFDWETIGLAVDHGDGEFEFEDAKAGRFPNRYYRIVSP